jgi:hypothetical protein
MDSSKLTRRIGAMAFSVLLAVVSLRLIFLLDEQAASFYLTSLVSTFEEVLSFSVPFRSIFLIMTSLGLGYLIKQNYYRALTTMTIIALLFITGSWLTTLVYSSFGYDTTSVFLLVIIVINLLISLIASALPIALISLFVIQVLRPV